jgi:glyceraldehyde 3-phosphate dehydrogenase
MNTPIRIGINGFGRIGRKIARLALENEKIEVAGINDLGDVKQLAHLMKYDSVHGNLKEDVWVDGNDLMIGDKKIRCFSERDPSKLPWGEVGAQVIHECTGIFRDPGGAGKHIQGGAKKVIISAPAIDPDITICMGVNHESYEAGKHHIISNASCTTNCLAPVVKILDDHYGFVRGTMLTVHSYTNDQRLLDLPHSDLRRARAAAVNQIPTTTGAAKAVGLVLPHLKGKLDGLAIRVPTPNVSLIDLTCELKEKTSVEEINAAFKNASETQMKNVLGFSQLPLVSSDFNGSLMSSTVDAELTNVMEGNFVKVISWYDNESGFSARMLDLTLWMGKSGF